LFLGLSDAGTDEQAVGARPHIICAVAPNINGNKTLPLSATKRSYN